jgi:tetratricopeptide (TPR) repeat protein
MLTDARITVMPISPVSSSVSEWFVIQKGQEYGPLSLDDLVGKVRSGEVAPDDLVKETRGLWQKVAECEVLQGELARTEAPGLKHAAAIDSLGRFNGIWISRRLLAVGSLFLLLTVTTAVIQQYRTTARVAASTQPEPAKEGARSNRRDAYRHVARANELADNKNYGQAMEEFAEAIKIDPTYAFAFCSRAHAYKTMHDYNSAIRDYTAAIQLDPSDSTLYSSRAYLRDLQKDYRGAILDYNEAIGFDPTKAELYWTRGTVWQSLDDFGSAIKDFTEAIRFKPTETQYYLSRGYAWAATRNYDKAIRDYDEAIRLQPTGMDADFARNLRQTALRAKTGLR